VYLLGEPGKPRRRGSGADVASYSWTAEMIADHVRALMKIREISRMYYSLLRPSSVDAGLLQANRSTL
jgi:hypothetical protein